MSLWIGEEENAVDQSRYSRPRMASRLSPRAPRLPPAPRRPLAPSRSPGFFAFVGERLRQDGYIAKSTFFGILIWRRPFTRSRNEMQTGLENIYGRENYWTDSGRLTILKYFCRVG